MPEALQKKIFVKRKAAKANVVVEQQGMPGGLSGLDEMLNLRLVRLKQTTIQQSRSMNDSQDNYSLVGDTENCPVLTIDEMPV